MTVGASLAMIVLADERKGEVAVRARSIGQVIGILLLLVALLQVGTPLVSAEAVITARPTSTLGEFEFQVSGFSDHETISTWLTGPSQQVLATDDHEVDGDGNRTFHIRLPRYLAPGRWAITAHGLSSGREAIAFFDVPLRRPDAFLSVNPTSVAPGTTVDVTGMGFGGDETISYWLTGPDGVQYPGDYVSTNDDGAMAFTYQIGTGSQPGLWTMSAYGVSSDRLGIAFFAVTGTPGAPPSEAQGVPATPAGMRPEESTQNFYAWYLAYPGNPLTSGAYQESAYLTDALKQKVAQQLASGINADPLVCAQDRPQAIAVSDVVITGDEAQVGVRTNFSDHGFSVMLKITDGQWKLNDIVCATPS